MKRRIKFEEATAANLDKLDVAKARLTLARHSMIAVPARVSEADVAKLQKQVQKYDARRMKLLAIGWGMKPQPFRGKYPV